MRVLLDNNIPVRFARLLGGHSVVHVRDRGWQSLTNGELVRAASAEYDALVSVDRNMPYQTSLKGCDLMVLILVARSNRLEELAGLVPNLLVSLDELRPGHYVSVL